MKIASRATPDGLAGHGLSTTALDLPSRPNLAKIGFEMSHETEIRS